MKCWRNTPIWNVSISVRSTVLTIYSLCLRSMPGKHVIIEKPFGITMRACQLMMEAADRNDKIISVAENYRLARIQRTRSWAIAQGRIGEPRMFFWVEVGEGLGKWGWRNFKMDAGGGWALDGGVHFTDLMRYILGLEAEEVYAINKAYEPYRYDNPERA